MPIFFVFRTPHAINFLLLLLSVYITVTSIIDKRSSFSPDL
jgi:hypothetical protein